MKEAGSKEDYCQMGAFFTVIYVVYILNLCNLFDKKALLICSV